MGDCLLWFLRRDKHRSFISLRNQIQFASNHQKDHANPHMQAGTSQHVFQQKRVSPAPFFTDSGMINVLRISCGGSTAFSVLSQKFQNKCVGFTRYSEDCEPISPVRRHQWHQCPLLVITSFSLSLLSEVGEEKSHKHFVVIPKMVLVLVHPWIIT